MAVRVAGSHMADGEAAVLDAEASEAQQPPVHGCPKSRESWRQGHGMTVPPRQPPALSLPSSLCTALELLCSGAALHALASFLKRG